jgi:hypothetical protein
MKRIYYLLSFIVAAVSFTACNPLDKTYKDIDALPTPANNTLKPLALNITLTAADYGFLTDYAKAALSFKTLDDAKADVPTILTKKYPTAIDKSSVIVTYGISPLTVKLDDSLNVDVAITLQTTPTNDYIFPAYNGAGANNFSDFSATAVINYLNYKYQTPLPDNSLRVLTYLYFESGKTPGTGTLTTDAFLFASGAWTKIYRVSTAQYTTTGNGLNSWFVANDLANIPSYLNAYLKADVSVMATAKYGDKKYVNYRYLTTYQKVMVLTFDGTNWVITPIASSPLAFLKTNGIWVADNTVTYALVKADYTYISAIPNVGSAAAMANLASFGNFNIQSGATGWTDDQINAGIAAFLKYKFTAAVADQKYVITYSAYNGANIVVTKTFKYDGTNFVYVP